MLRPPKHHVIKCHPGPFEKIWDQRKHHEFRKNDRDYCIGDTVEIKRHDPTIQEQINTRSVTVVITSIDYGPHWGIPDTYCVFSFHIIRCDEHIAHS